MEHILIIEDDANILITIKEILEFSGYQVSTAKNGKIGYEMIINSKPDLVLCDVSMPEMDGFELLGAINQRLQDQGIPPFLFLTAKIEKQDIRHGMNLGADDYLLKPFDNNELLSIIRLRLDKRKKLLQLGESNLSNTINSSFNKLALPTSEGFDFIPFDQIIRCQADRAYCKFYLTNGKELLVSKPMKEFEQILSSKDFIKVHKSYIVNIHCIEKYARGKTGSLELTDGSIVPVSGQNKEAILNVLKS